MFETEINPRGVREADIVVGIASYMEADSIAYPTQQADRGLRQYFGDQRSVIINCDNHSPDDTRSVFLATETEVPKIYITTPPNTPGKGFNFENMFRAAHVLGAKAIVCVDADLLSITPEWIRDLATPVMEGYDYVTPLYARHKYDGTITNMLCYPLISGLLGIDMRQPIGGDFALGGKFADHLLLQPWHRTSKQYGVDIFLSMNALFGGFKICQTGLGAKIHKPSAPKLSQMFLQVMGTAFLTILRNVHQWKDVTEVRPTPKFGRADLDDVADMEVDLDLIRGFAVDGFNECAAQIEAGLRPQTLEAVRKGFDRDDPTIDETTWVHVVFEMMAAYRVAENPISVLEALRSLYFGRVHTFMRQTWEMTTPEAEQIVLQQARRFFEERGHLLSLLGESGPEQTANVEGIPTSS